MDTLQLFVAVFKCMLLFSNMIMNILTPSIRDGRIINDIREHEILEQADIIRSKGLKNIVLVGVCKYSVLYLPVTLS